jgi:hypothetical protein
VTGQEVTVYNQDPATRGRFDVLLDNFSELDREFNGVDLTFNKRFTSRWMMISGLSLGRNWGDTFGVTGDLNNPNLAFRRGLFSNIQYASWGDVPVALKLSGVYQFPYGITVSGNAQHFTGFPEEDTVVVTASTVALTQVSQTIRIAPIGTNRLPDKNIVDLNVRKTFGIGRQVTVEPMMEVFNLTNAATIIARSTQLGPTYHRVSGVSAGRMWRFGFNLKY